MSEPQCRSTQRFTMGTYRCQKDQGHEGDHVIWGDRGPDVYWPRTHRPAPTKDPVSEPVIDTAAALTSDEVRLAYIDRKDFEDQVSRIERRGDDMAGAEFDRWLSALLDEARAEGARVALLAAADASGQYSTQLWLRMRAETENGEPR